MDYTPTMRERELLAEIRRLRQTCADAYVMFAPKAEDADETAMLDRLAKAANGESTKGDFLCRSKSKEKR